MLNEASVRRPDPRDLRSRSLLRLAALWLDHETMIRVFDWDPEIHGY
jgi:hypothetical protein